MSNSSPNNGASLRLPDAIRLINNNRKEYHHECMTQPRLVTRAITLDDSERHAAPRLVKSPYQGPDFRSDVQP